MAMLEPDIARLFEREVDRFLADRSPADHTGAAAAGGWQAYADLGWLGIMVPEAYGGMGGGLSDYLIVARGIGGALLKAPITLAAVVGTELALHVDDEGQRQTLLNGLCDGSLVPGLVRSGADTPGAGSEPVTASPDAGGVRLTGRCFCVPHAGDANLLLVVARSGGGDDGLYLVNPASDGLELHSYPMIDDRNAATVTFDRVFVPGDRRLAMPSVAAAMEKAGLSAAVATAAEAAGAMRALNELTLEHVRSRRQFGRALADFQVLQHRLVDMMIAERRSAAIVRTAAEAIDTGSPLAARLTAAAKITADRAGRFVGEAAIQLHGGMGMSEECAAGRYLKRLLYLAQSWGVADDHLDRLADTIINELEQETADVRHDA